MFEFGKVGVRAAKLREMYRNSPATMDAERSRIVTDYYRSHPNTPPMLLRAGVFKELLSNVTVRVEPDELLVGNLGKYYRGCPFAVEYDGAAWLINELRTGDFDRREAADGWARMLQEDRDYFLDPAFEEYWRDRKLSAYVDGFMPEGFEKVVCGGVLPYIPEGNCRSPHGHFNPNYAKVINRGFGSIRDEAAEALRTQTGDIAHADIEKMQFYRAVIEVSEAMIIYSGRYGAECERQAAQCADEARRQELLNMADSLCHIMEHPARTMREAMQAILLYHYALSLDGNLIGLTIGRIDQMLYPFYEKDMEEGRLTKESAEELMDCFFLKLTEFTMSGAVPFMQFYGAYTSNQRLTLAGRKKDGSDATNAVTYLCLRSAGRLKLHDPTLSLCVHSDSPAELIEAGLETNKLVGGAPTFENTDLIIDVMRKRGRTLEDARNFCIVGCVELTSSGCEFGNISGPFSRSFFNLNNLVNQAINNGVNPMNGKQAGLQTGSLAGMHSFQEVLNAYEKQFDYYMDWQQAMFIILEKAGNSRMPLPAASATIDGCLESGKDMVYGGAKYNSTGLACHGVGTAVDSLSAIRYLVFDKKLCTGQELLDAVCNNWEGAEHLRLAAVNEAPKFGNGDPETDALAAWLSNLFTRRVNRMSGPRGGFRAGIYSAGGNLATGRATWATPDGRHTGEVVSDGASPTHGADKNGPLSVLRSILSLNAENYHNGLQFCIRFHPSCFSRSDGIHKFRAMLETFFREGGMQLQMNIMDADTLRDAQAHPEDHRDLVVRVAGFSAYFIELHRDLQNDIILRTDHAM